MRDKPSSCTNGWSRAYRTLYLFFINNAAQCSAVIRLYRRKNEKILWEELHGCVQRVQSILQGNIAPKEFVQNVIKVLSNQFDVTGDLSALDEAFEGHRKNTERYYVRY
jgi:hypothetical protein